MDDPRNYLFKYFLR